jgi:hypothetical protein
MRVKTSHFASFLALASRSPKGELRVLADDLQSLYVRHLNGWICWACWSRRYEEMQCAHLFAKGEYHAGRYRLENVRCLCMRCHKYWTERPTGWTEYLRQRLGEAGYQQLRDRCSVRHGPHDYALVALDYRQQLEALPTLWKVREMYDKLIERGRRLGVWT